MWPDDRLMRLFGIAHPIIQSPMLGTSTVALAAAVSEAGGLGFVACARMEPEAVAAEWAALRRLTDAPAGLNLFADPPRPSALEPLPDGAREALRRLYEDTGAGAVPEPPEPPRLWQAGVTEVLLDLRPTVVSVHFGLPSEGDLGRLRAAGIRLMGSATTVREARALEAAGMDVVIAQGWEAGGHRGTHWTPDGRSHGPAALGEGVGTMALVPQVVDAVRVPVVAAGGIGDARGIRAALALGAAGVQMGTAFLLCPEAATDVPRRERLRRAADDDTVVTDAVSGRPARAARSEVMEVLRPFAGRLAPYPSQYAMTGPLREAGGPDEPAGFHLYGQAAALAREMPAGELVRALVAEVTAP